MVRISCSAYPKSTSPADPARAKASPSPAATASNTPIEVSAGGASQSGAGACAGHQRPLVLGLRGRVLAVCSAARTRASSESRVTPLLRDHADRPADDGDDGQLVAGRSPRWWSGCCWPSGGWRR